MLSCERVTELCSQELERRLRLPERAGLTTHLLMCSGCRNFRRQMRVLREVARGYAVGRASAEGTNDPPAGPAIRP